jgi:hypothetical protein
MTKDKQSGLCQLCLYNERNLNDYQQERNVKVDEQGRHVGKNCPCAHPQPQ